MYVCMYGASTQLLHVGRRGSSTGIHPHTSWRGISRLLSCWLGWLAGLEDGGLMWCKTCGLSDRERGYNISRLSAGTSPFVAATFVIHAKVPQWVRIVSLGCHCRGLREPVEGIQQYVVNKVVVILRLATTHVYEIKIVILFLFSSGSFFSYIHWRSFRSRW